MVMKTDGSVWTTGYNDKGQLGDGTDGENTKKNIFAEVVPGQLGEFEVEAEDNEGEGEG